MQMLLYILNRTPVIQGASYERICTAGGLLECLLKDFSFINQYGRICLQYFHSQAHLILIQNITHCTKLLLILLLYLQNTGHILLRILFLQFFCPILVDKREIFQQALQES